MVEERGRPRGGGGRFIHRVKAGTSSQAEASKRERSRVAPWWVCDVRRPGSPNPNRSERIPPGFLTKWTKSVRHSCDPSKRWVPAPLARPLLCLTHQPDERYLLDCSDPLDAIAQRSIAPIARCSNNLSRFSPRRSFYWSPQAIPAVQIDYPSHWAYETR